MSDLDGYEIEDIVWRLGQNDDHIVPHTEGKNSGFVVESDRFKRARVEVKCNEGNADRKTASDDITHRKGQGSFSALKEDKEEMLEKDTWSHSARGGFPDSLDGDVARKTSCSASDERRTSDQCLRSSNMDSVGRYLCGDDTSISDQTVAMGSLYPYQLNNTSHTENGLAFFGSGLEDEESNDLLFYGWPDLENIEDVDNIFRTCDSTFGIGIDNNDELGWFSSPHAIEGSDDALKSTFNFSECGPSDVNTVSEQQEVSGLSNTSTVPNGTAKLLPVSCKSGSPKLFPDSSPGVNSYSNGSAVSPHRDTQSQISHFSLSKHHTLLEGKRKERSVDNNVSIIQFNKNNEDESNHLLNPPNGLSSENHKRDVSHQTCSNMSIPLRKPSNSNPSNHVLPALESSSFVKSEDDGLVSISPRGSSHASNQAQSHDISLQNNSCSGNRKKERPHQRKLSRHTENSNLMVQKADSLVVSTDQATSTIENEAEGQSKVDVIGNGVQGELDSSAMQESSCTSSVVDDVSVDASSLHQLQHVMEQLDIRTKMCIRDSLYRLAKSAEQRHKCGSRDTKDVNGPLLSDGTNKCTGFMDMETDTNPIDRSIAHLLFHRPSNPSAVAASSEVVAMKSVIRAPDHGSLAAGKPVYGTALKEEGAEQRP